MYTYEVMFAIVVLTTAEKLTKPLKKNPHLWHTNDGHKKTEEFEK